MLDAYFGASTITLLAAAAGAVLVVWLLSPALPSAYARVWLPTVLTLFGLRLLAVQAYRHGWRDRLKSRHWLLFARVAAATQGMAWGLFGALIGVLAEPLHQAVVLTTLLVIVAGSASLVGVLPIIVPVFGILTLAPAIVGLFSWGDPLRIFMGLSGAMFVLTVGFALPRTVQALIRRLHSVGLEREQTLVHLETAEQMARVGHFVWDVERDCIEVSAQARRMFGLPEDRDPRPDEVTAGVDATELQRVRSLIREALRQRQSELRYETKVPSPSGVLHVQVVQRAEYRTDGRASRVMSTVQDISLQKEAQRELSALAFGDTLTGLPNRSGFQRMLHNVLAAPHPDDECIALLILDLDHFKSVNDTLGHEAGDRLLIVAAARLKACLRPGDGLARLGGDEFAVVLRAPEGSAAAAKTASRLIDELSRPFQLDEIEVYISSSIGIAMYPGDATEADSLLRCADVAMFDAKSRGRAGYQFHNVEQSARARERVRLDGDLRRAIERNELELHYQPKVRVSDGGVVGAEALLRWRRGSGALVPPDRFIPVAEDTGLIVPIGEWVLRTACETAVAWNAHQPPGAAALKIAVNLSPRQFWSPHFVDMVRSVLHDSGCRPEWIELEMTESLLIDSRGQVGEILVELRKLGFTLAIDDFGTGYSALGYLTRFPITTLKIDRSFVNEVATQPARAGIVRAVVGMGHSLGLELVAEGVEDADQAAALRQMGCHLAQGWLYGRPVPRAEFERLHAAALGPPVRGGDRAGEARETAALPA